jgi:hypothetical protein
VVSEDVDADDGAFPLRVGALHNVIVEMLLVAELVETLENELEEGFEVFRTGRSDEDVGVGVSDGEGDAETEGGRLATSARGGEGNGLGEGLGSDGIGEGEDSLGLIEGARLLDDLAHGLGLAQVRLELVELGLARRALPFPLAGLDSDDVLGL